eukprot:TRINITY_DN8480_c0_g1_i1.p1 TRINITY_DN8480_c0_g1~~TRINITY_DN8480_c0_g1_i1.p1  ORF type:complete len:510 (+),score=89.94 TRINITY_DN8480_c0_g1_i1:97-1626(+)
MACEEKIRRDFEIFDQRGRGQIGIDDLKRVLQHLDESEWQDGNCMLLLKQMDTDSDKCIDYSEFRDWILKQQESSFFTDGQYKALMEAKGGYRSSKVATSPATGSDNDLEHTLKELGLETDRARFIHASVADVRAAFDKYGDIGGNLKSDGTRVRTPWAGFPPTYWSSEEAAKKYMLASGEKTWNPPDPCIETSLWKEWTRKLLGQSWDASDDEAISKAFRLYDQDATGKIGFKNLKRVALELGERLADEELQDMIDLADKDEDGEVNEEEFRCIFRSEGLTIDDQQESSCFTEVQYKALMEAKGGYRSSKVATSPATGSDNDLEHTLKELGLETDRARFIHASVADVRAAFDKYGDIGGNLKSDGTRVRTPWAGFPPTYWSSEEAAKKYMLASGEKTWNPPDPCIETSLWKEWTRKLLGQSWDASDDEAISKAFRLYDQDATGKIGFKNLKRVALELGERLADEELQDMIDLADKDEDGEVNEEEFRCIFRSEGLTIDDDGEVSREEY